MTNLAAFVILWMLIAETSIGPASGLSQSDWDRWASAAKSTFEKAVDVGKDSIVKLSTAAGKVVNHVKDATLGERCNKRWIIANTSGLEQTLKASLCGQHIAIKHILASLGQLKRDFKSKSMHQPRLFHFYGGRGTGKTYAAQIVIDHLYRQGEYSSFVHVFSPAKDFPDRTMDYIYASRLRQKLIKLVSLCPHRLFIFDDFDKMSLLVNLALKPLLAKSRVQEFSRSIFLFMGTGGQERIMSTLISLYRDGASRDTLTADSFRQSRGPTTGTCGADRICDAGVDTTLESRFVDVPFLPLERAHVECCLKSAARRLSCSVEQYQDRLTKAVDFRKYERWEFAAAGCKKLAIQLIDVCL
ncbi:torsin-1A-like [Sycon ciliatum]|uniref:torsin-1A-like n=1 Tax=Sycon ciliatum TaxID=27933 RepID=UPI0020A91A58